MIYGSKDFKRHSTLRSKKYRQPIIIKNMGRLIKKKRGIEFEKHVATILNFGERKGGNNQSMVKEGSFISPRDIPLFGPRI